LVNRENRNNRLRTEGRNQGGAPGLHFSHKELAGRRARVASELVRQDLHGLLMFRQESMYYLTGYDTFGYVLEMTGALSPGRPVGEVDAHRRVLDAAGLREHRYAACGYPLGATFSPNWMEWPMLFSGNRVQAEPGMIFFLHCIVVNSGLGVAMTAGHTCIVTETGREVLSGRPLELVVV
jgi:Xaa-Pro aminopeptidase